MPKHPDPIKSEASISDADIAKLLNQWGVDGCKFDALYESQKNLGVAQGRADLLKNIVTFPAVLDGEKISDVVDTMYAGAVKMGQVQSAQCDASLAPPLPVPKAPQVPELQTLPPSSAEDLGTRLKNLGVDECKFNEIYEAGKADGIVKTPEANMKIIEAMQQKVGGSISAIVDGTHEDLKAMGKIQSSKCGGVSF